MQDLDTSLNQPATLIRFDRTDRRIHCTLRVATPGPERDLVEQFIAQLQILPWMAGQHVALFLEPMLQTGFPDLINIQYDPTVFCGWRSERFALVLDDFRILSYLLRSRETSLQVICQRIGWPRKALLKQFARLAQAGLIQWMDADTWLAPPEEQVLAIRRVISVEAKMHACQKVLEQANHNRWFAPESVVLLPSPRLSTEMQQTLENWHLGFWTSSPTGCQEIVAAPRDEIHRCYETVRLNEWIGRRLAVDKLIDQVEGPTINTATWDITTSTQITDIPSLQLSFDWG